jgi:hypothetical protein
VISPISLNRSPSTATRTSTRAEKATASVLFVGGELDGLPHLDSERRGPAGQRRAYGDADRLRTRRWCDMRVCGNRAKARRHYARHRRSGGS